MLMGNRVPCQALVPPHLDRFGGLPADDRNVMSLARQFPFPRAELSGSFEQVARVTSPPHKRIPGYLLLGECRIGNRLGILGKWAARQLAGRSVTCGRVPNSAGRGGGGWVTGPATVVPVSVVGAGTVPRERLQAT